MNKEKMKTPPPGGGGGGARLRRNPGLGHFPGLRRFPGLRQICKSNRNFAILQHFDAFRTFCHILLKRFKSIGKC